MLSQDVRRIGGLTRSSGSFEGTALEGQVGQATVDRQTHGTVLVVPTCMFVCKAAQCNRDDDVEALAGDIGGCVVGDTTMRFVVCPASWMESAKEAGILSEGGTPAGAETKENHKDATLRQGTVGDKQVA